jgi:glycyl-tRNA synthetase alpha subunit
LTLFTHRRYITTPPAKDISSRSQEDDPGRSSITERAVILQPWPRRRGSARHAFHPARAGARFGRSAGTPPCPSRHRPTRYGENSNRFRGLPFQVIHRVSQPPTQPTFIPGSLRAIGIDAGARDIRFVEMTGKPDARRGARLGFAVRRHEVSQFTHFQQVGGHTARPSAARSPWLLERHPQG